MLVITQQWHAVGLSTPSMKARKAKTSKTADERFIVKKPSKLKDYIQIYRMRNGVLKKAKELEKTLCAAA